MRLMSPAALSAGLGLALLAAPLAMAQAYANHPTATAHSMEGHSMQAPSHRMASPMHAPMGAKTHMQPREVSKRDHIVRDTHHAVVTPHHAMMAPHDDTSHHG